jgi:hypothetical protein
VICNFIGTVNGGNMEFELSNEGSTQPGSYGTQPSESSPYYLDTGTVDCAPYQTALFGYLTPIP